MKVIWRNSETLVSKKFCCGYCGNPLASETGYCALDPLDRQTVGYIYICHFCSAPTYFDYYDRQTPGVSYGEQVNHIPSKQVEAIYNEARSCLRCNAHTAAVLCCRKLLMNIAVAKGAEPGKRFAEYIEFLSNKGFVPPDGKGWVGYIRKKGNEATHEISIMEREDAEQLISFAEMLLKFIYEFPASLKKEKEPNSVENED